VITILNTHLHSFIKGTGENRGKGGGQDRGEDE
jgi:hypothetical protein